MFYLQIGTKREPTSGLESHSCFSYEFACVHTNPSYCVRKLRLFRGFSTIWQSHLVHCVPVRTSPVAVRVAVSPARLHTGSENETIRLPCAASSAPSG